MAPPAPPVHPYIGRFAPSPTGPLHLGSLVAALASYLDARAHQGRWLLRMEDLDPPRESPAAARAILQTLETLGLHWDGAVLYQSQRHQAYADALQQLQERNLAFPCDCSRRDIRAHGGIYPGTCRQRRSPPQGACAIRCRVDERVIGFDDLWQGYQHQQLAREVGDFVIRRKDGLYAYQLAVVVDDAHQGITHVIRGMDLLDSTPRQIYLQQCLGLPTPRYGHFPVIVNALGQKLSKQHKARPVDTQRPGELLVQGLRYLQQAPEAGLAGAACEDILAWAVGHWNPAVLAGRREIPEFVPGN